MRLSIKMKNNLWSQLNIAFSLTAFSSRGDRTKRPCKSENTTLFQNSIDVIENNAKKEAFSECPDKQKTCYIL